MFSWCTLLMTYHIAMMQCQDTNFALKQVTRLEHHWEVVNTKIYESNEQQITEVLFESTEKNVTIR